MSRTMNNKIILKKKENECMIEMFGHLAIRKFLEARFFKGQKKSTVVLNEA